MKQLLLASAIILSACATAPSEVRPPVTEKQTEFVYPHVKRPNLLVADLDRSLAIYRDILGFDDAPIGESALDSFSYPVFKIPREARMRYVYLGEPGEDRVFGLMKISGVDLPRPSAAPHMSTVVIGVTGLAEIKDKLRAAGLEISTTRTSGRVEFTFKEMSFVDPDGHMIVLYEVLD
ncbi:VOC family protein [uncultured Algimonas sp.]|uniref:VOC family protein n=1 Tax=uncultured Algimonas sp. TaxID=1547920 RepID=UPI00261637CD|nr:VOC family protein [uncultured Algimonas sp.]